MCCVVMGENNGITFILSLIPMFIEAPWSNIFGLNNHRRSININLNLLILELHSKLLVVWRVG